MTVRAPGKLKSLYTVHRKSVRTSRTENRSQDLYCPMVEGKIWTTLKNPKPCNYPVSLLLSISSAPHGLAEEKDTPSTHNLPMSSTWFLSRAPRVYSALLHAVLPCSSMFHHRHETYCAMGFCSCSHHRRPCRFHPAEWTLRCRELKSKPGLERDALVCVCVLEWAACA